MAQKKPGKVLFKGMESGMRFFRVMVLLLIIYFWLSGIQTVQTTNVGILTRFGKVVPSETSNVRQPGIVLALPRPIDELIQIPKGQEQKIEIEDVWASLDLPIKNNKIDPLREGYCITGDNNVVQTKIVVKYVINNPELYHFGLANPEELIRDLVLASLTQTISGWTVDESLQFQRTYFEDKKMDFANFHESASGEISASGMAVLSGTEELGVTGRSGAENKISVTEKLNEVVTTRAQARLDALESGILLRDVDFIFMHYPRHVNKDFENVRTSRIAVETAKEAARGEADRIRQEASRFENDLITQADTYKKAILAQAKAYQEEFEPLYREYRLAPEYVWRRTYMDTMEEVWHNVGDKKFVPANTRIFIPNWRNVNEY
ncbi:MAG: SPFH domain-containing protein [Planctomycetia bacterium]|nr:SPFH domain-containing protein [Planctomycetia bacterium]